MIYELRAYDLLPGKGPAYLDLFRRDGVQYVTRHLPMAGFWLTDSGALNRLYHLWIYRDLEERLEARSGLAADAEWNGRFVPEGFPLIVSQRNMLMALEEGSPALDTVEANRKSVHGPQPEEAPMFAPGYMSLSFGDVPHTQGRIGRFRVISGEAPGEVVSLYAHGPDDPFGPATAAGRHELLRPMAISPLH